MSCFAGLVTAYISDTALHQFVLAKKQGSAAGQPQEQLLQTGVVSKLHLCLVRCLFSR